MGFCTQVKSLLQKEFLLSKRHYLRTIFEIFVPVVCMVLVVVMKVSFEPTTIPAGPSYTKNTTVALSPNPNEGFEIMGGVINYGKFMDIFFQMGNFTLGIVNSSNDFASTVYTYIKDYPVPIMTFESEESMLEYARHPTKKNLTTAVMFTSQESPNFAYKLYFDQGIMQDLSSNYNDELNKNPQTLVWNLTWYSGIYFLKSVVDTLILRKVTNKQNAEITYGFAPMRYAESKNDAFAFMGDLIISVFFVISMLIPAVVLIGKFMNDKVSRIRETMRMKGLSDFTYFLSYFIYYFLQQFIVCIICTIMIKVAIFPLSNPIIIFLFIYIFTLSIYPYSILISALFQKPWMAQILGFMIFYMLSTVTMFFTRAFMASHKAKMGFSLISCVVFNLGIEVINRAEAAGKAVNFSTIGSISSYGISMPELFPLMFLDFVILLLIGIYLTNVMPSAGGVRKPLLFFLMPSYWGCGSRRVQEQNADALLDKEESKEQLSANFERLSGNMLGNNTEDKILRVQGLTKRFDEKPVVKNLNLELYSNQIFVLLGHNGAGKTTTISMLTGMLNPTSGNAKAFGIDMFNNLNDVIENIGVCTQDDIFFEELTVLEHLHIFGVFKGMSNEEILRESEQYLTDLKLNQYKNTQAKNLSGGNKRKLMVALAFLGKPKLVFLDEPTSGMDTTLRREFWDILANYKRDRIILLTTHYMDEADALGDNIGIMARGKLICCGSSMFLKKRFGIGYNLNISKTSPSVNSGAILEYIQKTIPTASIESDLSGELQIRLPFNESAKFKTFFMEMDSKIADLSIKAYGISITTLEEVFLRAGMEDSKLKLKAIPEEEKKLPDSEKTVSPSQAGIFTLTEQSQRSGCEQFLVMIAKKFKEYIKNPSVLVFQFFLPLIILSVGFFSQKGMLSLRSHWYSVSSDLPGTHITLNKKTIYGNSDLSAFLQGFGEQSRGNLRPIDMEQMKPTYEHVRDIANNIFSSNIYHQGSYVLYDIDKQIGRYQFITMINLLNPQASFAFAHEMARFIIKDAAIDAGVNVDMNIQQMSVYEFVREIVNTMTKSSQFSSWTSLGLGFIPGLIVTYLVREYANDLKSHLLLSGLKLHIYWIAYFLVDTILLYIPVGFLIFFYKIFELVLPYAWVLLLAYPPAQVAFSYLISLPSKNESGLFLINTLVHALTGMFLPTVFMILRLFDATRLVGQILIHILSFFPMFALVWGVFISANGTIFAMIEKRDKPYEFWDYEIGLQPFIYLLLEGPLYILAIALIEYVFTPKKRNNERQLPLPAYRYKYKTDSDVSEEEKKVQETNPKAAAVYIQGASKIYPPSTLLAASNINFTVSPGEIFALLGVNGAGKSTTFKMITNHITPNRGQVLVNGKDTLQKSWWQNSGSEVGYCPQNNILFDNLTMRNHFDMYAAIKGIPENKREELIHEILKTLDIEEYSNVIANKLSGGTKRKMSVGLALLGNPPVLILDEPSTGIDPQARRHMWDLIISVSRKWSKCAVILSTHLMEEAEALSSRLAIMVNGTIRCIGSSTYIKSKFAKGYCVEAKFANPTVEQMNEYLKKSNLALTLETTKTLYEIKQFFTSQKLEFLLPLLANGNPEGEDFIALCQNIDNVPMKFVLKFILLNLWKNEIIENLSKSCGRTVAEIVSTAHYKFTIKKAGIPIGSIFGLMEDLKSIVPIYDYSVLQTSLEEVFHQFAKIGEREQKQQYAGIYGITAVKDDDSEDTKTEQ